MLLGINAKVGGVVELENRTSGTYVVGKTGTGKTGLLSLMALQDIEAGNGVCVIDPHRDMVDEILLHIPGKRLDDIVLVDLLDPDFAFGLNIFECSNPNDPILVAEVREQAVRVFKKVWGKEAWGDRLEDLLRNISHTLIENQGYTLNDVSRLLYNADFRRQLTDRLTNPTVKEFWQYSYNPRSDYEQRQLNDSTLNKVRAFTSDALLSHIVGQAKSTIDLKQIMEKKKILLVKLDARLEASTKLLGSMLIGRIVTAGMGRSNKNELFAVYADEFELFETPDFETLFRQIRKFGVATTIAHQGRGGLDVSLKNSTLQGNLVVFEVVGTDAEELAGQFDHTPPQPEVTGQKPTLALATDPWVHLKKSGHSVPLINKAFLGAESLMRTQQELYALIEQALKEQYNEQEELLRNNMEYHSQYVMSPDHRFSKARYKEHQESKDELTLHLDPNAFNVRLSDEIRRYLVKMMTGELAYLKPDFPTLREPHFVEDFVIQAYGKNADRWFNKEDRVRLRAFIKLLHILGELLEQEPIYVSSGQYEPIYGNPRTYADMHNEIISKLTTLGKYKAYVRTGGKQYELATVRMGVPKRQDLSKVWISNTHLRLRSKVEEEIRKRADDSPPMPVKQKPKPQPQPKPEPKPEPSPKAEPVKAPEEVKEAPKIRIVGKRLND